MPFSSELPNGWAVRFSASPSFDKDMQHIEFGIAPDIPCSLSEEDAAKGIDTLIEKAREILNLTLALPSVASGDSLPFVGSNPHSVDSLKTPVAQGEGD